MSVSTSRPLAEGVAGLAHDLTGASGDFDPVLDIVGDARFVLIGEASHGTHEFYRIRGEITKRLIRERGFTAVAVEADWPDAYRINRYVRGAGADRDATEALGGFKRFPQWMWRNADVLDFIGWMRAHNDTIAATDRRVGFYGLDLYSLHTSIDAVLQYLGTVDPDAARRARARYACFDHFGGDPQAYGYAVTHRVSESCENDVVRQLLDLREAAAEYARRDGRADPDALFAAEQNARLVVRAEQYYRAMFRGRVESWNLRDSHMNETLLSLAAYLGRTHPAKVVVWAHNSHLGDARATHMGVAGEHNLGQLTRQQQGDDAVLIGFTTFTGSVTAASDWGEAAECKRVRPALKGSYERLFHEARASNYLIDLTGSSDVIAEMREPLLERAIGVIYRPETERASHYFQASLPGQFDAVLHYDSTRAVEPLERNPEWEPGEPELPETYPTAL